MWVNLERDIYSALGALAASGIALATAAGATRGSARWLRLTAALTSAAAGGAGANRLTARH